MLSTSPSATAPQPVSKRPRLNHPLRQTSFPERDVDPRVSSGSRKPTTGGGGGGGGGGDNESFSGSYTGSFSGSFSGSFPGLKKKRGRKELSRKPSVTGTADGAGGPAASKSRAVSTKAESVAEDGGYEDGGAGEDDEDDEDEDEVELMAKGEVEHATSAETEKKNIAYGFLRPLVYCLLYGGSCFPHTNSLGRLLTDAFTPDQSSRYDSFKRAKLNKPTVRKIVNQTLSQSVPPNVITTISGYTKVFIGELIEKARLVQEEWAAIEEILQEDDKKRQEEEEERRRTEDPKTSKDQQTDEAERNGSIKQEGNTTQATALPSQPSQPSQTQAQASSQTQTQSQSQPPQETPNPHRSQLLPQHIREALRRYRRDGEGGGVGFSGLSLGSQGLRGSFVWSGRAAGGRRLFR